MIDTYLKAADEAALTQFCSYFSNSMPVRMREGEPTFWFTCIRAPIAVSGVGDIHVADDAEGRAVCGVWS